MGRSVPPWRTRVEAELQGLLPFRRALSTYDQDALDQLCDAVRSRRAAGGMLPNVGTWQPMLLSMLVGLTAQVRQLSERVRQLEEGRRDD